MEWRGREGDRERDADGQRALVKDALAVSD